MVIPLCSFQFDGICLCAALELVRLFSMSILQHPLSLARALADRLIVMRQSDCQRLDAPFVEEQGDHGNSCVECVMFISCALCAMLVTCVTSAAFIMQCYSTALFDAVAKSRSQHLHLYGDSNKCNIHQVLVNVCLDLPVVVRDFS